MSGVSNPPLLNHPLHCVCGFRNRCSIVLEAQGGTVASTCGLLVFRVYCCALVALLFFWFRCGIVGSLVPFCRPSLGAFCYCAFLVSCFMFPVFDAQSAVSFVFFLHGPSLP